MSSKRMSPTATLLRNSRLFSLPPPLPRPLNDFSGHVTGNRMSDTATAQYPTQQAIATTPAALGRGDWGLKRPLPLRSTTKSGTPIFRINAIDTREHITDFESASDLTFTLQKFQELNLPITSQAARQLSSRSEPRVSVFNNRMDNTSEKVGHSIKRWKFHGPWMAGMVQADFEEYVNKQVGSRKDEFLAWLRKQRLEELKRIARKDATHEGRAPEDAVKDVQLSEDDFASYIKTLRNDTTLGGTLERLITSFLDLPPQFSLNQGASLDNDGVDAQPPTTHPSAGLSYLRSDAFLDNHPLWGPQARHPPVEARVLVGVGPSDSLKRSGKVGVAGVTATAPEPHGRATTTPRISSNPSAVTDYDTSDSSYRARQQSGGTLGIDLNGGNRIWVEPMAASIDPRGRIDLQVKNADHVAVEVHKGTVAENVPLQQARITLKAPSFYKPPVSGYRQTNPASDIERLLSSAGINEQDNQRPRDTFST